MDSIEGLNYIYMPQLHRLSLSKLATSRLQQNQISGHLEKSIIPSLKVSFPWFTNYFIQLKITF
jgi:hypothetical protein